MLVRGAGQLGDSRPTAALSFTGGGQAFTVEGLPYASSSGVASTGFAWRLGRTVDVVLSYDVRASREQTQHAVRAGIAFD